MRLTQEESDRWRARLGPLDSTNEKIFLSLYATILFWSKIPTAYLDVGSGTGAMVNMARRIGIPAYGVDVVHSHESWLIEHDLTEPLHLLDKDGKTQQFDLITSLEVAEHIPEEYSDIYIDSIARHMAHGGILVFSAAPPGQSGDGHVNCQPAGYWRDKFFLRGISYQYEMTAKLSTLWNIVAGSLYWLVSNVQVFNR